MSSKERLRKKCQDSLFYLAKYILGFDFLIERFHKPICDFIQDMTVHRKLLRMGRGFLKTTVCSQALPIWLTINNPNVRILLANMVYDNAAKNVHVIRKKWENCTRLRELFPEFFPQGHAHSARWSDACAEVKRTADWDVGTYESIGVGGSKIGSHYNFIIEDDLVGAKKDSLSGQEILPNADDIQKAIGWHALALNLLVNPKEDYIFNIGCMPQSVKVLKADGTFENINKLKVNDEIVTFDNGSKFSKIEAVIPQCVDDIYEIRTTWNKISANKRHPFLKYQDGKLLWTRLRDLQKDDFLVTLRNYPEGKSKTFSMEYYYGKRKNTALLETSEKLLWLFGFITGDGWITEHLNHRSWITCVSLSVDNGLNNKVKKLFEVLFGIILRDTRFGYAKCESIKVARFLLKMELKKGAKNKDIPDWVFTLPIKQRLAFIRGLLEADGHYRTQNRWAIEVSSKKLIEDLRRLCSISGLSATNVYKRSRLCQPPHSPKPVLSKTYHTAINFGGRNQNKQFKTAVKTNHLPENYGLERIIDISYIGKEKVYDLTIANTHNFIAEGLVVHNTRWGQYDLIRHIQDNQPYYKKWEIDAVEMDEKGEIVLDKDGSWIPTYPERFDLERLEEIRDEQGDYIFSMMYLGKPYNVEDMIFRDEWVKVFDGSLPEGKLYAGLDAAFAKTKRSDYTAIPRVHVSADKELRIHDYVRAKLNPSQIIDKVFELKDDERGFEWIAIEKTTYEQTLKHYIELRNRERAKTSKPPVIVKPVKRPKGETKAMHIRALQPLCMAGNFYIRPWMRELRNEFREFTGKDTGGHDDLLDAIADIFHLIHYPQHSLPAKVRDPFSLESVMNELLEKKCEPVRARQLLER